MDVSLIKILRQPAIYLRVDGYFYFLDQLHTAFTQVPYLCNMKYAFLCLSTLLSTTIWSQDRPKLLVGIVVDQMRADYLDRFRPLFGEDGFERLRREGAEFRFAHFNYVPTYTGPGHASIYTGATPFHHGIISNDWYDPQLADEVYCVEDAEMQTVGADNASGQCSPHRMRSGSLGDALGLHTYGESKVFGISIKDRGAILPAGHSADAAYWYDAETGHFVSSSYYGKESLPKWLQSFNAEDRAIKSMASHWELLHARTAYRLMAPDEGPGERDVFEEGDASFPHTFGHLSKSQKRSLIRFTPHGNKLLTDLAIALLQEERLGLDDVPDMLAVSYSSPDYIGHAYGPNSWEIADNYARLDREIARLLTALDQEVGKGNYVLFLTADHGVKPNGAVLQTMNIPGGSLPSSAIEQEAKNYLQERWGDSTLLQTVFDHHLHLNHQRIVEMKLPYEEIVNDLRRHLIRHFEEVHQVFTQLDLKGFSARRSMEFMVLNGMQPQRCGDLVIELHPNFITGNHALGTTHGSSFDYDSHVPLLFFGHSVPVMRSTEEVFVIDIAATVSEIVGMMEPDGNIGRPLF